MPKSTCFGRDIGLLARGNCSPYVPLNRARQLHRIRMPVSVHSTALHESYFNGTNKPSNGVGSVASRTSLSLQDQAPYNGQDAMSLFDLPSTKAPEPEVSNEMVHVKSHSLEVIWGPGKNAEEIASLLGSAAARQETAIVLQVSLEVFERVSIVLPGATYNAAARMVIMRPPGLKGSKRKLPGTVALMSSATADSVVAEECRAAADVLGCYCFRLPGGGLNGMQKVLSNVEALRVADVIIVVMGKDMSLASMVAGVVDSPVIGVPTSAGLHNGTPVTTQSCPPGVSLVGSDSGFGAALLASRILGIAAKRSQPAPKAA